MPKLFFDIVALLGLGGWAVVLVLTPLAARSAQPVEEGAGVEAEQPLPQWPRAPIGVVDDARLEQGQWMLSYRYHREHLEGLRNGGTRLSAPEAIALGNYETVPTEMDAQVHTFSLLYSPIDRMNVHVTVPLVELDMQHAGEPSLHTLGVGDMTVGVTGRFMDKGRENINLGISLGIPTGSTTEEGALVAGSTRHPYAMQPGGGTWSLRPVVTYSGVRGDGSWGLQADSIFNLGSNDEDYRRGFELGVSAWGAWSWTSWLRTSLRFDWDKWNNVRGKDVRFPVPARSPTQDSYRQAGMRIAVGPGVDFEIPGIKQRLAFEMLWPIWEELDGPQLAQAWSLTAGWQWAF